MSRIPRKDRCVARAPRGGRDSTRVDSAAQEALRSPLDREAILARLSTDRFDVAIIGGGINGAAIARDAAMRGLKVALIEKGDFAGATSSRSSKLIHGGLRYLPQGHLRLVYQALRERERLSRVTAPHLVRPIRFVMPFFRSRRPSHYAIRVALTLYDFMARIQHLTATEVVKLEPGLRTEGLVGGASYADASGDDARLTLENLIDSAAHGAAILNYAALESLGPSAPYRSLAARDLPSGERFDLSARAVVNAAGPWVDDIRRIDDPTCTPLTRLTKGVHLIVPALRLPVRNPLVLSDRAGRIIFVIPLDGYVMIGTTDTDFAGNREKVPVEPADVEYLLGIVNEAIPEAAVAAVDVAYGLAGLRALPRSGGGGVPSSVPREELITVSPTGLVTIAGGKLTTHRAIAEAVVDRLVKRLAMSVRPCATRTTPLPGARPIGKDWGPSDEVWTGMPASIRITLQTRYGTRASLVARLAAERPELAKPLMPGASIIGAEVVFAARYELARTVDDFLVRRTALSWRTPAVAALAAPAVERVLAAEFG